MIEHTPTPWTTRLRDSEVIVYGPDKIQVVSTSWHTNIRASYPLKTESLANAAFIVNAVNNHDALMRRVAALELIIAEEVNPFNCRDDLNRMLVEEICNRIPDDVGGVGKP